MTSRDRIDKAWRKYQRELQNDQRVTQDPNSSPAHLAAAHQDHQRAFDAYIKSVG